MARKRAEPGTAPVVRKLTEYIVLRRYSDAIADRGADFEVWEPMRTESAKNDVEACRQAARALAHEEHVEGAEFRSGDWKAVPASSWRGGIRISNEVKAVASVESLDTPRSIDARAEEE